jgi:uncharacterized protein (DUF1015 family)
MPEIQAFRGVRYDLGHIGALSDVTAPPYDVISPELQLDLYRKHPCNVIRLILNRMEPGDDEVSNRYTRAARFLKNWRSEGVLFEDAQPAIYVYHQTFAAEGPSTPGAGSWPACGSRRSAKGWYFPTRKPSPARKSIG